MMRSEALIRSGHIIVSPCDIFKSNEEHEFSCKFDDAQVEGSPSNVKGVLFAPLKVYLWWTIIFEKIKKKKVQKSHAWANETELTKESKVNLVWQSLLIRTD